MRRVFDLLEKRTTEFARAPLFNFLGDTSIDPRQRLSFAPGVAHFVMSFRDLYALVLREEPAKDEYQAIVNAHASEDDNHWRWFLSDLGKIGYDPQLSLSDALRFVWSDSTVSIRMLSYHMCRLGLGADSLHKLVLVHCIEGAGKVTVGHVAKVGNEFAALTGTRLVYLGQHHSDTEEDHTLEQPAVREALEQKTLDPALASELCSVVDESFDCFGAFADELLALAKSGHHLAA